MGKLATLARRTFLIGTAAVVGGVAIGYFAYKRDPENPLLDGLSEGEATLNPYVRIDADGVTLITPRADKGQGAVSIQAALIAEEMDLAWGDFKTDFGVPSAAYYNGKVAVEGFPIAATSDTVLARAGRQAGDVIGKFVGMQITGGSSTVADAYDKLRVAGAVARQMLLLAAAQQSGVALADLTTKDGAVILPDGKALSYASLAAAAAQVVPPTDVALKPEAEWRYLGQPMMRLDTVAKSTGRAEYGIDVRLPDMVYATVRANPRLGGGMASMDASEAEKAKGVIKVVALPQGFGVIADNTWRAFQAAALVKPVWGPSPYPETSEVLLEGLKKAVVPGQHDSRFRDDGDASLMIQTAGDAAIKAEYRVPYLAHAPLEPMSAVAQWKDGVLEIWTGTQIPRFVVDGVAKVTGIDAQNIRLHVLIMGGSFGRRLEDDYVKQAALLAQAHPGVPIKLTWTREEDMAHDFPRPQALARLSGTVKDGQVHAMDLDIASCSVSASQMGRLGFPAAGPDVAIVAGAWDQPFAIPNYRVTGYKAPEAVPISSWRSVGASGNGFLHESALDELIHAAGADPLAERLRLCSHEPSKRVLQAVGEMCDWATPLAVSPEGPRGRGLAFTLSFGVPVAEVVEVTATAEGIRIDKVFVACEVGKVLDPVNFENQVMGGVVFGLGHAINCELTYEGGAPTQTNFHAYPGLRLNQTPQIVVKALETTGEIKGIGEPSVPPAAPALANAIYAATGQRIRELPLNKAVGFV